MTMRVLIDNQRVTETAFVILLMFINKRAPPPQIRGFNITPLIITLRTDKGSSLTSSGGVPYLRWLLVGGGGGRIP